LESLAAKRNQRALVRTNVSLNDGQTADKPEEQEVSYEGWFMPPLKTNVLLLGVDAGEALTDVMIICCFDRDTGKVSLVSIPRDTYVKLSKDLVSEMQRDGHHPPSSGVMKANAAHSWGGEDGSKYTAKMAEETLGIKIDYYVLVNTSALRSIVDATGGVWMEIPEGGFYYSDPYQDLRIAVPAGLQRLDGEMAEGVVRFRDTYREGDIQRIRVQHEFMKEFFKQTLSKSNIMKNFFSYANTIIKYVETDFPITDLPKYLKYVSKLDPDNIETHTLPGFAPKDSPYYYLDEAATKTLVDEIFYSTDAVDEETRDGETGEDGETVENKDNEASEVEEDSESVAAMTVTASLNDDEIKNLRVQVLNGGSVEGLAAKTQRRLEADGFNVVNIDTYTANRSNETRVLTNDRSNAAAFLEYFPGAVTEPLASTSRYDVVIILGLDEK
jgi:LCP family protein required for cell wall assembly